MLKLSGLSGAASSTELAKSVSLIWYASLPPCLAGKQGNEFSLEVVGHLPSQGSPVLVETSAGGTNSSSHWADHVTTLGATERLVGMLGHGDMALAPDSEELSQSGRETDFGISYSMGSDPRERGKMIARAASTTKHGSVEVEVRPKPIMLVDEALKLKEDSQGLDSSFPSNHEKVVLHLKVAL